MGCMPQSGGCERPFTDAFVQHYNETFGTDYIHKLCLDRLDSTKKQPEALYEGSDSHRQLVVERKSIAWPPDYARRHHNDHWVGDLFRRELGNLLGDALYELHLPALLTGTEAEIRPWVVMAVSKLKERWQEIQAGDVLGSAEGSSIRWWFRRIPELDREHGEPVTGLKVSSARTPEYLDSHDPPAELGTMLLRIYDACVLKFADYGTTTRILVVDPLQDLRYNDAQWWADVFERYPPPPEIDQIWSGVFDWVDDDSRGWTFELLRSSSDATTKASKSSGV
jgi:hypothetical protein